MSSLGPPLGGAGVVTESSAPCQDVSRCGQLCALAGAVGEVWMVGGGMSVVSPAEGRHQD